MATDLGKVGMVTKGAWNSSATYEVLDVVSYTDGLYIAKQAVPANTPPTNTTYWQMAIATKDWTYVGTATSSSELALPSGWTELYAVLISSANTTVNKSFSVLTDIFTQASIGTFNLFEGYHAGATTNYASIQCKVGGVKPTINNIDGVNQLSTSTLYVWVK